MSDEKDEAPESPNVHFEPLVSLPLVSQETLEEDEDELLKLRARLYRYDSSVEPSEWKERGTGDVKLLKHKKGGTVRILMRREKTLKICANHYILPTMQLKPNCGSDKVWVWSTPADYADESNHGELLAIRFGNAENAQKFFDKFEEAKKLMEERAKTEGTQDTTTEDAGDSAVPDDVTEKLEALSVTEEKKADDPPTDSSEKEADR